MTQLGKTGKTGKPTRIAFVAEQVSQIMMKVEPRLAELRAVTSLARLLANEEPDTARAMLSTAIAAFDQGFDTADLRDAAAWLATLSAGGRGSTESIPLDG